MFTRARLIFLIIIFGFVIGCGTSSISDLSETRIPTEKTETPSATPLSPSITPTSTSIPPTETSIPPTDVPPTATPWPQVIIPGPYDIRALLILPKEVSPNWYLNEDNFERFGWNLTLAGMHESILSCPPVKNFYGLQDPVSDFLIPDINEVDDYHAIAIMPASKKNAQPFGDLLDSPEMLNLLQGADENGKGIYATCGGVRVLAAAGILDGRSITGEPTFLAEYQAAGATYVGEKILPVFSWNQVTRKLPSMHFCSPGMDTSL